MEQTGDTFSNDVLGSRRLKPNNETWTTSQVLFGESPIHMPTIRETILWQETQACPEVFGYS